MEIVEEPEPKSPPRKRSKDQAAEETAANEDEYRSLTADQLFSEVEQHEMRSQASVASQDQPQPGQGDDGLVTMRVSGIACTGTCPQSQLLMSNLQEFKSEMQTLKQGLLDLKVLLEAMQTFKQTGDPTAMVNIMGQPSQKSTPSLVLTRAAAVAQPDENDPFKYSNIETKIKIYFPMNKYTKTMEWFLKQDIVREFMKFEVMRKVYEKNPPFKPDAEQVASKYIDYLLSPRMQGHFAKATGSSALVDFGRAKLPRAILNIADEDLKGLAKGRIPGSKDNAEFIKDKCNASRRTHLLKSDYLKEATSIQDVAIRILWDRHDFFEDHLVSELFLL